MTLAKIAEALNKAQAEMSGAVKNKKNPHWKSSYADLASVFDAIRDAFAENGLSITQTMDILENGRTVLQTRLMHSSGEFIDSRMMLPDIPNPQHLGSALSYYRRYSLMAISGVPQKDDDGEKITKEVQEKEKKKEAKEVPKTIGEVSGGLLKEAISEFPEYRDEVLSFLSTRNIDFHDLSHKNANRIWDQINILREERKVMPIEEAQHG